VQGGGTSAASPVVAGTAALCLQHTPGADWLQVRNAILYCARNDTFTGPVASAPDNTWGYGKVDAFAALSNCFLTTTGPGNTAAVSADVVFPNPAAAGQSVTVLVAPGVTQISIVNMLGEKVLSNAVQAGQNQVTLRTEHLPPGIYLLSTNAGTVSRLVIR
jgi:minor extracellular serine protease Vpr